MDINHIELNFNLKRKISEKLVEVSTYQSINKLGFV